MAGGGQRDPAADGAGPADAEDYRDIDAIMRHIGALDFRRATHDLMAGVDLLRDDPAVDPGRIGVWGYCTGGRWR